jgi:xylulose-5-phosphate/fructose-6-phosphate phosphoketolase
MARAADGSRSLPFRRDRLNPDALERTIAYWEAANYLTAAQIYLRDNPLLREPLDPEHTKSHGCWATGAPRRA